HRSAGQAIQAIRQVNGIGDTQEHKNCKGNREIIRKNPVDGQKWKVDNPDAAKNDGYGNRQNLTDKFHLVIQIQTVIPQAKHQYDRKANQIAERKLIEFKPPKQGSYSTDNHGKSANTGNQPL